MNISLRGSGWLREVWCRARRESMLRQPRTTLRQMRTTLRRCAPRRHEEHEGHEETRKMDIVRERFVYASVPLIFKFTIGVNTVVDNKFSDFAFLRATSCPSCLRGAQLTETRCPRYSCPAAERV